MDNLIAAISTSTGVGGIGIVRMSGTGAIELADRVFVPSSGSSLIDSENRKLVYGHIYDGSILIDEVLIAPMKGPKTYTREDMVEIYTHGGIVSVRKVLELLLKNGAAPAERGEFTKRAFLNGRLDLTEAEGIIDVINAKTDYSYNQGLNQMSGGLSSKIKSAREKLVGIMALIVANVDFPDEDIVDAVYGELIESCKSVKDEIDNMLKKSKRGKLIREGIVTVILGKPNVGKSSLLNEVLSEERAIVTDIPGTTRDTIEEFVDLDGILLNIKDTAGIRDTDDEVEKIGVDRAVLAVEDADFVIGVFDCSREFNSEDESIVDLLKEKNSICILNKTDLKKVYDGDFLREKTGRDVIETSLINGIGVDELKKYITEIFFEGNLDSNSEIYINRTRHIEELNKASNSLNLAIEALEVGEFLDCVEVDINDALENLSSIIGESVGEDVLDRVFSEFCIGK